LRKVIAFIAFRQLLAPPNPGITMMERLPVACLKLLMLLCLAATAMPARAAEQAGSVSFAIGEARIINRDGNAVPATRGAVVAAGQSLVTGATGHIHVRMVDGAFVSVRPQSRLHIEEYRYDAAAPAGSRIKFMLEQGVVRSITGRGGEAARENYRLNTPLAAIGIRGTDFVAQAAEGVTRVTVQSGAVVMAPLGAECSAGTLGPCSSAAARVLTAAMRDAYLELRSHHDAPLLVPAQKALDSPNLIAPPRPEEPGASPDGPAGTTTTGDSQDAVREATAGEIRNQLGAVVVAPAVPPASETLPLPALPPPDQKFWWGRWSTFVQPGQESSSLVAALGPGREISFANQVFGLVREQGVVTLPASGTVGFRLADSEAMVLKGNQTLTAARISAPSLAIDFGERRFETALTVHGDDMAPVAVQAAGHVTFQGDFFNDANASGTVVMGTLSRDTSQAGYVFQRDVSGGLSVLGVTRWLRGQP
jgi:hypothetical protein